MQDKQRLTYLIANFICKKKKLSSIKHDLNFRARSDGVVAGIIKQIQAFIEHESDIHGGDKYTRKGKKNGGIHKKGGRSGRYTRKGGVA